MKELFTINLQLFGELNTNTTLDSGLSVENKTYYDRNLIEAAQPNLVHNQFGQKRDIPRNGGKKIEFRTYAALPKALTPLTEGVKPDGNKLSATAIEAEIGQYGSYVTLSDMLDLTAIDNNVLEATTANGRQAGLTIDTLTRNVLNSGKNVFYCRKVAADGTETVVDSRAGLDKTCRLTVKMVNRVVAFLKANNAPKIDGSFVAIIHPHMAMELMNDPMWRHPHEYKDTENLYTGELGSIAGCRFVESSEAKIFDGGVYSTLFFGEGAFGTTEVTGGGLEVIVNQLGSGGVADPLHQISTVGWKATHAATILVPAYIVRCESMGEFSDTVEEN